MDIINFIQTIILSASPTELLAMLALLVSVLSAFNSSRAIKITLKSEKRSQKLEIQAKEIQINEKKYEAIKPLNKALIQLSQVKICVTQCELLLSTLLDLTLKSSKQENIANCKSVIKSINELDTRRSELEFKIRKSHNVIKEETKILKFDQYLVESYALLELAALELKKIQSINDQISEGILVFRKVRFKKHGIDL